MQNTATNMYLRNTNIQQVVAAVAASKYNLDLK